MTTKTTVAIPSLEVVELETQRLPLSDVSPHEANPKTHTEEQIQVTVKLSAEARATVASWFTQKMQAEILAADKVILVYDSGDLDGEKERVP